MISCAENLAFRYPQNGHGLEPVSLGVQAGEAVWIAGPSGCGKSTLARCLTGLIPHLYRGKLKGRAWVDGLPTVTTPLWQLAERAGLVFQNPAAQMLTHSVEEELIFGLENLGLPRAAIDARLDEVLAHFDLTPLRQRSPHTLSGGEQQKVALAAVMARRPPLLVLDEPLSMLDSVAVADLVASLDALVADGVALVLCEHRAAPLRRLTTLRTVWLQPPTEEAPTVSPPPPFPADATAPFTLTLSDVNVTLGGRAVLNRLSFSARSGQVVAIVGRNGVGKTTLLRALAGLQPHTGVITVDGQRPDFTMVFQNPDLQLFNATVREEVLYRLPDPDMARYAWLMETLGLQAYQSTPPLLLSEGEKKRVGLAIALMRRPRHGILLDEPALGQDEAHKERLVRLTRALADAGQLVILTTHDSSLAAHADHMLLLSPGGLIAEGPPASVARNQTAWTQAGLLPPTSNVNGTQINADER